MGIEWALFLCELCQSGQRGLSKQHHCTLENWRLGYLTALCSFEDESGTSSEATETVELLADKVSFLAQRDVAMWLLGPCTITEPVAGHQAGTMPHRPRFLYGWLLTCHVSSKRKRYIRFVCGENGWFEVLPYVTSLSLLVAPWIPAVPLALAVTTFRCGRINDFGVYFA